MIKLVVWDWNGTLFADTEACVAAGNHKMKTFGGRQLSRSQYVLNFSFPALDFYCANGCDRESVCRPEAAKVFHDFYEPRASKCRTRRGARETLRWLDDQGVESLILSNHITEAIKRQLSRLNLSSYLSDVLGNRDLHATQVGNNKVNRMRDYLQRTRYRPKEALIVGDSPEDVGIGKELGMRTAAIKHGYFSTSRLRASQPDYLIGCLSEVRNIVDVMREQ